MPDPLPNHKPRAAFKAPLAALAASFALGIIGAHSFPAATGVYGFLVCAAACILLGLLLLRAGWGRTAVWFALASLMFTGVVAARRWEQRFPLHHVRYLESLGVSLQDPVRLEGKVISSPYRTGYGLQFDVEARQIESLTHSFPVSGKIRLRVLGSERVMLPTAAARSKSDSVTRFEPSPACASPISIKTPAASISAVGWKISKTFTGLEP